MRANFEMKRKRVAAGFAASFGASLTASVGAAGSATFSTSFFWLLSFTLSRFRQER